MQLTNFTSLTPEEFLNLNKDKLSVEVVEYFEYLSQRIIELEEDLYGTDYD